MLTPEDAYVEELEDNLNNLEDENDANEAEGAPAEAEEEDDNKKPVKPKRVVRNPQPKLNEQTLKGPRGLTALPSYFDRVKYKGKGYEEQDLSMILKTYEYWCHRLFPKYPFDDCIAKIEQLGSKRATVTHVKKIRLDMICEDEPIVNNDIAESDPDDNINDQFDNLFESVDTLAAVEITEEQEERIRLNKERAEKLRWEKLNKARGLGGSLRQEPSGSQSQNTDNLFNENSTQNSWQSESDIQNSTSPGHSHYEEDVDSIFDKIRKYNGERETLETDISDDEQIHSTNRICEPKSREFQVSNLDFQTPEVTETHLSEAVSSQSECQNEDEENRID